MPAFRMLGPLEIRDAGGQPATLARRKQRVLLALLLLRANTVVRTDEILDALWGERPPASARANLHSYVSDLRRTLARVAPAERPRPDSVAKGYRLELSPGECDAAIFESLAAEGSRALAAGRPAVAAERLARALGLWRGRVLEGLDGYGWLGPCTARLEEARLTALEDHVEARLALGQHLDLTLELTSATARHPLRERLWGQLMVALHRTGRRPEALRVYERLCLLLEAELGVRPGETVRRIHRDIRSDASAASCSPPGAAACSAVGYPAPAGAGTGGPLRVPAPAPPAAGVADPARSTGAVRPAGGEHGAAAPDGRPVPAQLPADPSMFTGRHAELAALSAVLTGPTEQTRTAVVSACGGVGKTWLAVHWAHRHRELFPDGQLFVDLRGFDPSGRPTAPEAALLGFLDALGVAPGAAPADADAQVGLYRSLLAGRRILVVMDNARNAEQVVPLLPGSAGCATIVTSRDRLTTLVSRHGAHPVPLDVLTEADARQLLSRRLGTERMAASPDAVAQVTAACGGLPLALGIAAARVAVQSRQAFPVIAGQLRDAATRLDALDEEHPEGGLRAVLSWSHAALDPAAARVFTLLGLNPGPDISTPAAVALTGLPHAQVAAVLRILDRQSLLVQQTAGRWRPHDLIRLYAAERAVRDLPDAERTAAVDRLVGFYLGTAHRADGRLEPGREPVALDDCAAGVDPLPLADEAAVIRWYEAEDRCLLAVQQIAAEHGRHRAAWQLAWLTDVFYRRRGRSADRLAIWQLALAAARQAGDPTAQALTGRFLGCVLATAGQHAPAVEHLHQALTLAERGGDLRARADTHRAISWAHGLVGEDRPAFEHAVVALRLYRSLDGRALAHALNGVGWYAARLGRHEQASGHLQAALRLARSRDDRGTEANALDSLGYLAHRTGRHHLALCYYQQAIALARDLGYRVVEADTLAHLGDTYAALGDLDRADAHWREALRQYRAQHRTAEADRLRRQIGGTDRGGATGPPGRDHRADPAAE
ncbi:AfsR/SARP family transcriptional regulator [Plantactinospora sp. CA-290183]|uniref:AfsR/SARP family transcriptional regulator n=1 Tax=Plantactinospora sp. CA-290183 TaxID=3240006 RepID=UPI003D8C7AAC